MSAVELAPRILAGTPPWVWAVLLLLAALGVRRLRPRRTHLVVAAPAPFTLWSLSGAAAATRLAPVSLVFAIWATALVLGALTVRLHPGPPIAHLGGCVFAFPATVVPLLLYLTVFGARYALGVGTALEPARERVRPGPDGDLGRDRGAIHRGFRAAAPPGFVSGAPGRYSGLSAQALGGSGACANIEASTSTAPGPARAIPRRWK